MRPHTDSISPTNNEHCPLEIQGFVGPFPSFATEALLEECRLKLEQMIIEGQTHPLYGRYSVRDWHLVDATVLSLFTHPAVVDPLKTLLGPDLNLWRSKIFYKRAEDRELGWHQEWGYFNGEEIGNDKPSLSPGDNANDWWDVTVWIALDDVTADNGALQFVKGSHKTRYPIDMVPMPDSAFFHDPFIGIDDATTLIQKTKTSTLVLDIDTSAMFDDVDPTSYTLDEAKSHVLNKLSAHKAAITLPFDAKAGDIVTLTARKGEFVLFTERTMHRSLPNASPYGRMAINCRVTPTNTLVYPSRLTGDFVDGSNINISRHKCVLLAGVDRNGNNVY